ncbi:hypothetical protein SAMN05443245_5866 [Paraburkholderia fungorum]|uniref:Uncharacterized protein n=1 Tax=Paraburkholderia fungorum TaxID=134537 RepID=A0A1H1IZ37_9BURK|nr:hypothetical protein [Paraburkholderia fungorum]SDR42616.1 hypothetical protein SAMN05443245_5866 [Paraburkholderia fungorum]
MTDAERLVARLNSMSANELAEFSRQQTARLDAEQIARFGYAASAEMQGRKVDMSHYRADAAQPQIKAVKHRDQTGREITEYRAEPGASMRQWMGQWMLPGFKQLAVFNPNGESQRAFLQRGERLKNEYLAAVANRMRGV